jgi:type IV pilus assembly protein PilA
MIQRISDRLRNREEGFTLIELMVVVLIIAILIAIAIPTFLGARKRAQDRAAQSSLRNAVTAAKAIFTDNEDYADADESALQEGEPALDFIAAATDSQDQTEVSTATFEVVSSTGKDNRFLAAAMSATGTCWYVQDITGPANTTNAGTTWEQVPTALTCNASSATVPFAYDNAAWKKKPGDTS